MKFKILLLEKEYLAIHKPSGFLTYADSKDQVRYSCKDHLAFQLKKIIYPVHRIDKETCGILVFALSKEMAKTLTDLFRTRTVKKKYLAIVHGETAKIGVVDTPLKKHKEKILEPASTRYFRKGILRLMVDGEERIYSLLECEPETGRFHQIRRHLKSIGHPIVGDPEYGNNFDNCFFKKEFSIARTMLSAIELRFPDQKKEQMIRIVTKPDADFQKIKLLFKAL